MSLITFILLVTVLFSKFTLGEEASVLKGATMGSYEIYNAFNWNPVSLIDGNFQSVAYIQSPSS